MALADEFDSLLIDLDGVVWKGREPLPGAPEALAQMLAAGKRIAFVTNNPGRRPDAYAERLAAVGVEIPASRVITAGVAAARLAASVAAPGGGAFVIGAAPLREMVAEEILSARPAASAAAPLLRAEEAAAAAVVVVSGHRGFDYEELLGAKLALDAGAGLIATSRDPTLPMPGGEWPGTGSILAAVETASGRVAEIAGKPERHLFELALAALDGGGQRPAMVGDRLTSDIDGGRRAGLETVLVLSGTTTREQAEAARPGPDHLIDDLAALLR